MEPNQIAGSEAQAGPRQTREARFGASCADQCHSLCGALGLRLATPAGGLSSVANGLRLFPPLEPGLDLAIHPRRAARLAAKIRGTQRGTDGGYLGALVQWVKQLRPFGKLRLEIVRRCDRLKGFHVLPKRWIVERTFGWFSKARRLRSDYEVRLDHSEAMIRICMIRLMVKRLALYERHF